MEKIFKGTRRVKINWGNFTGHAAQAERGGQNVWLGPVAFANNVPITQGPLAGWYAHYRNDFKHVMAHELFHICGAPENDADKYATILFGPRIATREPIP